MNNSTRLALVGVGFLVALHALLGNVVAGFFAVHSVLVKVLIGGGFLLTIIALIRIDLQKWLSEHTKDERDTQDHRNREAMLDKVRTIWITGLLDQSLEKAARIALGLAARPEAVVRSLDVVNRLPPQAPHHLQPTTQIVDVFEQQAGGQLLILGAPGAGKTTLLLELTRDLLIRAQQNATYPMPVVFPLSSWAQKRYALADWLVDELHQRYDVPRQIAQAWIEHNHVLPLLDGLDEVGQSYRADCVEAINRFRQDGHGLLPLVVCCRVADYEAIGTALRLQSAVVVQPLTRAQVNEYLVGVGAPLAALRLSLQTDATLWELLDTPLMLNIVTLAYGNQPQATLHTGGSLAARRQQLFASYVDRMFRRRTRAISYRREQTVHWLTWLARQMVQRSLTVFYIERMQPDWCPNWKKWRLVGGLVGGLFVGLVAGLGFGLVAGLVGGLVTIFSEGLSLGEVEKKSIPNQGIRRSARNALLVGLGFGLGGGVVVGVVVGLIAGLVVELVVGLIVGLIVGLVVGLVAGLGGGLVTIFSEGLSLGEVEKKSIPNQGIRRSARNALLVGLGFGLGFGLVVELGFGLVVELGFGLGDVLVAGLVAGLGVGLGGGLVARLGGGLGSESIVLAESVRWSVSTVNLRDGVFVGLVGGLVTIFSKGLSLGEVEKKSIPNQGIRRSARNALLVGLGFGLVSGMFVGLVGGLVVGLVVGLDAGLDAGLVFGLGGGLIFGLGGGLAAGGSACLNHFLLRFLLVRDSSIPWNYPAFLDVAAKYLFLRKVGGGYIFIHRLLMEYFAALPDGQKPND